MAFTSWRGVVGCIKPTMRPGGLEELIRMLPDGIGVIPLFLNISEGTTAEFKRAVAPYEPLVQEDALPRYRNCARIACKLPVGKVKLVDSTCLPPAGGTMVLMNVHVGLLAFAA